MNGDCRGESNGNGKRQRQRQRQGKGNDKGKDKGLTSEEVSYISCGPSVGV